MAEIRSKDDEWVELVLQYQELKAQLKRELARIASERTDEEKQEEMDEIAEAVAVKNRRINIFRQFDWYARRDNFVHAPREKKRRSRV